MKCVKSRTLVGLTVSAIFHAFLLTLLSSMLFVFVTCRGNAAHAEPACSKKFLLMGNDSDLGTLEKRMEKLAKRVENLEEKLKALRERCRCQTSQTKGKKPSSSPSGYPKAPVGKRYEKRRVRVGVQCDGRGNCYPVYQEQWVLVEE